MHLAPDLDFQGVGSEHCLPGVDFASNLLYPLGAFKRSFKKNTLCRGSVLQEKLEEEQKMLSVGFHAQNRDWVRHP